MPATMPAGYQSRYDPSKNYEQHLFRAGKVLQGAEVNEIQELASDRLRQIGNALFRDGTIVRDCVVIIDPETGKAICSSGAVYLRGAVRGVPSGELTIPTVGVVSIGVRLLETVVTELEDVDLLDPAVGQRNYGQSGAARLKVDPVWAWDGDGGEADYFPIYTVENGILSPKDAPAQIDAISQAISKYDRDSAGGTYVVRGLSCGLLPDAGGNKVYSVSEGAARVRGRSLEFATSRRLAYLSDPDLRFVNAEPHASAGTAPQRINCNLYPVGNITEVLITAQKTVTLTHGAFVGAQDAMPDASVVSIQSVTQGGTTYVAGADYQLTLNKVDWSLAGAEPATGSTYNVTYRYITTAAPTAIDSSGFTVEGAVTGTLVLVSYNQMLPRIDRLCVSENGDFVYLKGVAASWNPLPPDVPENLLKLATIIQTWDASRSIINDGVRVVPMQDISALGERVDRLLMLVAQQRLESSVHTREAGVIAGLFTDPFLDDSMRDAGEAQTGAIFNGILTLPITAHVGYCDNRDPEEASSLAFSTISPVQQLFRTGSMKVNPYSAFAPLPASVALQPSVDRWTETDVVWTSPVTQRITLPPANLWSWLSSPTQGGASSQTEEQLLSTRSEAADKLRSIEVHFTIKGFGSGENLSAVTFDGITVVPTAI